MAAGNQVAVIDGSVAPDVFYRSHIATRTPAALRRWQLPADLAALRSWKDLAYLRSVASGAHVKVEKRATAADGFGEGREMRTTLGRFLDLMEAGDQRFYMTTQDLEADEEGRPRIFGPPVTQLIDAAPAKQGGKPLTLRPALMGNLVPANVNLWIGCSRDGAQSGLHHDYHDNLYVLLRGRKRVQLIAPAFAAQLALRGPLLRVHDNGRICYEGAETLPDGSTQEARDARAAAERFRAAEGALEAASARLEALEAGGAAAEELQAAAAAVEDCEREMDAAMDGLADAEMDDATDDEGDDDEGDGGEVLDAGAAVDGLLAAAAGALAAGGAAADVHEGELTASGASDDEAMDRPVASAEELTGESLPAAKAPPSNFSRVDPRLGAGAAEAKWPGSGAALRAMSVVELSAGDALYIPAGWFHNVTSLGQPGEDGVHIAANFWFHPPDNGAAADPCKPYSSDFWDQEWAERGLE